MRLLRNHDALALVNLSPFAPVADGAAPEESAAVTSKIAGNRFDASFTAREQGFLWFSLAPIKGWRWCLDGETIRPEQGPGILQFISVEGGEHQLEGRDCPPGVVAAGVVSSAAVLVVIVLIVVGRKVGPVAALDTLEER